MQHLSILIKPASAACDMRCAYCFYADVSDLRQVKNHGIMTPAVSEAIVQKAFLAEPTSISFCFQGGEPTLAGLDYFKHFVKIVEKEKKQNIAITYALQTNGLHVNDEWAAFFRQHNFLLGLSLDGDKSIHDNLRRDSQGNPSFNRVLKTVKILNKHRVEFNILCVVSRQIAAQPQRVYSFFKRNGLSYLQFIACLDGLKEERGANPYSLTGEAYGRFLVGLFDAWYQDWQQGKYYSIRLFDNYIRMLTGKEPESCAMRGICGGYPVIEADGSVYPCDFYVLDEWRLGNITEDTIGTLMSGLPAQQFTALSYEGKDGCQDCEYVHLCRSGCRRNREQPDGTMAHNAFCAAYKMFFSQCLERLQDCAESLGRINGGM